MNSLPLTGRIEASGFLAQRVLLRLANPARPPLSGSDAALIRSLEDRAKAVSSGYQTAVVVTEQVEDLAGFREVARLGTGFDWLAAQDLIAVEPMAKRYRVLWRQAARHNAFLVTDRCDHGCLMCSQPPRDVDDGWIIDEIRECLALLPSETSAVGFTGGEPFLDWRRFIPLVQATQETLPDAAVHVLTNGRAFSRAEVVEAWSQMDRARACVGIPIYSAVDTIHDYVVQSHHALDETVLGILRLKDKGNRVEVRVVLHRLTVERLVETCEWLARNLPFLDHIALMGMEDTGFALANHSALWVDPIDYGRVLSRAVAVLSAARMRTSIYNLPLCVLPAAVRPFAVQSISDWKNAYPEVCAPCDERGRCAGFFTTGRPKLSRAIAPIKVFGA
jgi:His-Xaa-Ser system radical SAM maturase HxsC